MDNGFPSGLDLLFGDVEDIEATPTQAPVRRPRGHQIPYGNTGGGSPKRRSKQKRRARRAAPSVKATTSTKATAPVGKVATEVSPEAATAIDGMAEAEEAYRKEEIGARWTDFAQKLGFGPYDGSSSPAFEYMMARARGEAVPFPSSLPPQMQQSIDAYAEVNGSYHLAVPKYLERLKKERRREAEPEKAVAQTEEPTSVVSPEPPIPSGLDMLFDDEPKVAPEAEQPAPEVTSGPQKQQRSWYDPVGYYNYFSGADRDPKYKDVQGFNPGDMPDIQGSKAVASATLAGADDERYADVIQEQLKGRFLKRFKDANGATIIEFVGKNGKKEQRYVNAPGLDYQDVDRGLSGALPYMLGGGLAGSATRTAGIGSQMLAQGLTAGGLSATGDVVNNSLGAKQGVDPWKAGLTAAFAGFGQGAAHGVGLLYRRLIAEPRLYNRAAGTLTSEGAKAAREAGLEPGQVSQAIARNFAKEMAKTGDAKLAGVRVRTRNEFGIPSTSGQRTKKPSQLTNEEIMRRGGYGEKAERGILRFDDSQREALERAALGDNGVRTSIARQLDPSFDPSDTAPAVFGQRIGDGIRAAENVARSREREAWEQVSELLPTRTAVQELAQAINQSLGGRVINPRVTPTAHEMRTSLMEFIENVGRPAEHEGSQIIGGQAIRSVDQMRRMLGEWLKGTRNDTDEAAANAIYQGYNNWIRESAEAGVLSGRNDDAARLFTAIDISYAVNQVFRPRGDVANNAAGRFIKNVIDDAVTPEGLVTDMIGSSFKSAPKKGAAQALNSIRNGVMNFLPEAQANQTWNAIRIAHWSRIVKAKNGELVGPQAMLSNLRGALEQQGSIMRQLYTPSEVATMRSFQRTLEGIVYKPPNASGSGVAAAAEARKSIMNILGSFSRGPMGRFVSSIFDNTIGPLARNIEGGAALTKAIRQGPTKPLNPVLGNYSGALTNESYRQKQPTAPNRGLLQ